MCEIESPRMTGKTALGLRNAHYQCSLLKKRVCYIVMKDERVEILRNRIKKEWKDYSECGHLIDFVTWEEFFDQKGQLCQ